jgi:hypothetical protein
MLLDRRELHGALHSGRIRAITLYSDASPVTGEEVQGVVVNLVYIDDTVVTKILPGASLSYGNANSMAKTVAVLHGIWLLAGPDEETVKLFLDKVRCITTDFGTEVGTLDSPDILRAYLRRLGGMDLKDCAEAVRHDSRLFENALRIGGWSHQLGNIMKNVAKLKSNWPQTLQALRDLCAFYKNKTWREHLTKRLRTRIDCAPLKSFTASFAKWRYETLWKVLTELQRVREVSQVGIRKELFLNFQDKELIRAILNHCDNPELWVFIVVSANLIFTPLEELRRWGMICPCEECNDLRRRHVAKHTHCWKMDADCTRHGLTPRQVPDLCGTRRVDSHLRMLKVAWDLC